MTNHRVLLGFVARAHGLRGALRMRPASGQPDDTAASLRKVKALFLGEQRYALRRAQSEKEDVLIELEGVDDRNAADALRGSEVFCERSELPRISDDEIYMADLIGCEVVTEDGASLGRVTGSFHAGAHETLIVQGAKEHMLPWVGGMVVSTDLVAKKIVYAPPPGLVDANDDDRPEEA